LTYHPHSSPDSEVRTLDFEYAVYALGAGMPDPVNVWSRPEEELETSSFGVFHDHEEKLAGGKRSGVRWMASKAGTLKKAQRICIVGAGALGIRECCQCNGAI
jgi:hypothetical protein